MSRTRNHRHLGFLALACLTAAVTACGGTGTGVTVEPATTSAAPPSASPQVSGRPRTPPASPEATSESPPGFTAKVSAVSARELGESWRPGCPVPTEDLRKVTMTYWGFDERAHTGELVVHRAVTDDVTAVFRRLYDWRFPITRMRTIDVYKGSDFDSIEADNTSAFNCRRTTGASSWSKHAYGRAIDLNPRENPWVEPDGSVAHRNARAFAKRPLREPGVVNPGDRVVSLFEKYGWEWGGYFSGAKDYQHFSKGGG
ncbi:M15 family metallopeptidase [Sphaerisporangium sp. TRM90804]|uniref:M15 family metallopeptidase n=1 Tax=Sphaerisporangium sp. TRM90804 TaxID=3031113 RepID=UPI00244A79BC|nr:M15 family metallopeptidase [Sphaerisporangium sp. TRM90804]MDH2425717.1 M15 family metallopeptidase [Sphaerisporangium sp. TRM90804]